MPKLEVLKICSFPITGSCLVSFSNLKELDCRGCENLSDDNLIRFLRCANNLQLLNLEGCNKITNSVIEFAIEITVNQKNNLILEIDVSQSGVDINKIVGKSSLVYLRDYLANDLKNESEDELKDESENDSDSESENESGGESEEDPVYKSKNE